MNISKKFVFDFKNTVHIAANQFELKMKLQMR